MMFNGFDPITPVFNLCKFLIIFAVPLALWKLIDIAIWIFSHININWVTP